MKFTPKVPPRTFEVGIEGQKLVLQDCGRIELQPDEQVTFVTPSGAELDVARKSWGYYPLPSLNSRLPRFGLRGVLVRGFDGKYFVLLVEKGKEPDFESYLSREKQEVVVWLDTTASLDEIERKIRGR